MDSPLRVFIACGDILQGSYFEVLFHQLPDGAVPKLAADRTWKIEGQQLRVSLTTDSGLAHYPARLNDMYKQADIIVLVYSMVDRTVFETLSSRIDYIVGPLRDFAPAAFILLGVIPPGCSNSPRVVSPQELESLCSQFSATRFELDTNTSRRDLDEFWTFAVQAHRATFQSSGTRSQAMVKDEVLLPLLTNLIMKKEWTEDLAKAVALISAKKNDKLLKAALKASGKREQFTIRPIRAEAYNANLLTPVYSTFTITNTTKGPLNWMVVEPDFLSASVFFSCSDSSGSLAKGKSATITACCVFYQPAELSRFLLIESPQEPGLCAPIFVRCVAPLQPRDPLATWKIDRKAISIGFRISSTPNANVYRSTLYGAVVAVKEWTVDATGAPPDAFFVEWDAFVKLKHPNIAQFLGGNHENGQAFMVLEYLKYGQLGTFLHNPPPRGVLRTIDLRLKMAADLAKAMAYLHSQKMLHRDLTSANVLVDSDCSVKLGDFGEAKTASSISKSTGETGSLDWTAPELLTGAQHTTKSDIFSFGIILWEFGAERLPARTMVDVRNATLPGLPMELKTRYPAFAELVAQCTHMDPDTRPSFDEIVQRLEAIRAAGPVSYAPAPVAKIAAKPEPPRYIPQGLPNVTSPAKTGTTSPSQRLPTANRAAPPPMQQKIESVILPELSLGPEQIPPSSPRSAIASLHPNVNHEIMPNVVSNAKYAPKGDAIGKVGVSQSAGVLSPRSGASAMDSAATGSSVPLGGQAKQTMGTMPTQMIHAASAPLTRLPPNTSSVGHLGGPDGKITSPRNALPSAMPLIAPGRAPAGSFVPPANLAPPPLSMTDTGTPVTTAMTLLRMPSVSKLGAPGPLSPTSPTSPPIFAPVSPRKGPAPSFPIVPPSMAPTIAHAALTVASTTPIAPAANAKLDNLIDWANDAYDDSDIPGPPPDPDSDSSPHTHPFSAGGSGNPMTAPSIEDSPFDTLI